jgi:dephospho-CoA kinase
MKVVGLTGGLGMGKSTCSDMLRARRIPVVDTDDLAREVVEPGEPALAEIARALGERFVDETGRLRRRELARHVFPNPAARKQLEEILHPRIRQIWRSRIEHWRSDGHTLAVVVIPLLFETNAEQELDATICVACSSQTQQKRLASRGWSAEQVRQRIEAQLPVETKMARADFVIWNESSLEVHQAQLDRILAVLK